MLSHHFFTRNNFYIPHYLKIRSSYKNIVYLTINTTLLVGYQMVVFLGEIRVSNNKIMSSSEFKNVFTFLVS